MCTFLYLNDISVVGDFCLEWWWRWRWGTRVRWWGCSSSSSAESCTFRMVWRPVYFRHWQVHLLYFMCV